MDLPRALTVVVLAGCGRIGFDADASSDARSDGSAGVADTPSLPICLTDDVSDGVGDAGLPMAADGRSSRA